MSTRQTIDAYFANLKTKENWQPFLAEDMTFTSFSSPVKRISGRDAYVDATKRFYSSVIDFEITSMLVDGDRACALTRYQLQAPGKPAFECDVAEVFRVTDGRISSFDIYFDPAPFAK